MRIFSASSGVTGAEPVEHNRNADRSASASWGRSTSFDHCVGTPHPIVACSVTICSSIDSAVHGVAVSTQLMTNSTWSQSLFMYPACANGTGIRRTSWYALRMSLNRADASSARWSNHAPFGSPVVPLVHTMQTGSSGSRCGRSGNAVPACHAAATSALDIITAGVGASGGTAKVAASCRSAAGSQRCRMAATSPGPRRVLMPVATAPRRVHAA